MNEILDAVVDVLLEVGYDKLTFDLVSAKAKASKATLYRKWPTKAQLVLAALHDSSACSAAQLPTCNTGSLAGDLAEMRSASMKKSQSMPAVLGAVASALPRDEELRDGLWETFSKPRIELFRQMLINAQARGEVRADADVDLLALVLPAFGLQHTLRYGIAADTDYFERVAQHVLLPAARA